MRSVYSGEKDCGARPRRTLAGGSRACRYVVRVYPQSGHSGNPDRQGSALPGSTIGCRAKNATTGRGAETPAALAVSAPLAVEYSGGDSDRQGEVTAATASISTRRPARQRGDRHRRARRPVVAEGLGVDLVHRGEVGHVHQEDRRLHHLDEVRSRRPRGWRGGSGAPARSAPRCRRPPAPPLAGSNATWPAVNRKPPARCAWL